MDKGDGLINTAHFWRERSPDSDFENSENSRDDSSVENSPFRGFEKEPKVLIPKFNIEELLYKSDSTKKLKGKPNGANNILPQILSNCFVKLARDDLEQLKKDVLENCRLNKAKTNEILNMPLLHCKICEKAYCSEKKLQNHLENKHMLVYKAGFTRKPQKRVSFSDHVIVHELKEYHKCRKCTRIFKNYKCLKAHMKREHRKRKCYICHYCSKNFVDRMFFKVHIKLHCDVCGLLLPNKNRYMIHRRETCRVIKKYPCKTCHDMFFSYMDLKDHSYDHLEDLFICDICKEQHSTKCAVSHHIMFLHSKKRPKELFVNRNLGNEKLYLCRFCEDSSIDRDAIERHVAVLPDFSNRKRTGYKDYYFCDQCLRKFNTETDMLQHKWSHFLNTSENSQVLKGKKIKRENALETPRNEIRRIFKIDEKIPNLMQPKIVLERIDYLNPEYKIEFSNGNNLVNIDSGEDSEIIIKGGSAKNGIVDLKPQRNVGSLGEEVVNLTSLPGVDLTADEEIIDVTSQEVSVIMKKAIVDPKSKKTLISKFQCQKCHKYYSSNYCLNRHMLTMHHDLAKLQCGVCEETFVWPSLLKSHNCIRMNSSEMDFDVATREVQIDSYNDFGQAGFDDLMNISESENYMNTVDFEIPAPIVQLTEYENGVVNSNGNFVMENNDFGLPLNNSYKIVMQEVPIEF